MSTWNILYRGRLSSCNYACEYCPFAKTSNTAVELREDAEGLQRFVAWAGRQTKRVGVLFTPWGEGLVHAHYRRALTELSRLPHVYRVGIQTNLSASVGDLAAGDRSKLALWATFHPTEVSMSAFLSRCAELDRLGIRYSVGVVGVREQFEVIEELRTLLAPEVYLWINALAGYGDYYLPGETERLARVDPYFAWNGRRYPSGGGECGAGETSFTVDGRGDIRRCHFVEGILGNIYEPGFERCLMPRTCTASTCDCHIGYVHRPVLNLAKLYGDGLLERIPATWPLVDSDFSNGPGPGLL